MTDRSLGHRAPLLWLALPFMAGLVAARSGATLPPMLALTLGLAAAAAAAALSGSAPRAGLAALAAAMVFAGDASFALHRRRLPAWDGRGPREVRVALRIDHVYPQASSRKAGGLAVIVRTEGRWRELAGQRIYYSVLLGRGQPPPERSAVVSMRGLLAVIPRDPPPNTFFGSLAGEGLNFVLIRGRIIREERPAAAYYRLCDRIADRMRQRLGAGLERHPDLAAMFRAMMLGWKSDLTPEQKLLFMHSGAMHLFAINGVHIGMVAAALHALFSLIRCPRLPASIGVLAVLWLDVDTTGASPSAVRAFVMVAVLEAAYAFRRPCNPIAALAASALLILLLNPMDLFSASFQMSYAVVGAILTLGIPLASRLERRFPAFPHLPELSWTRSHHMLAAAKRHVLQAAGIGVAAALVGAITGISFFGLFTPGGVVANILLVPLASGVITSGCLSLFLLHWQGNAGLVFNHAAAVLLFAIEALMRRGSQVPGTWFPAHYRAAWIGPAALSALLVSLFAGYARGWRREGGGWLPPIVIVAATLAFGVKFG